MPEIIRPMFGIAEAFSDRPGLAQVIFKDGYAQATDSYRAIRVKLPDELAKAEGSITKGEDGWPDSRLDWDQLARDHLKPTEHSFPNLMSFYDKPRHHSEISWEGDGGWRHGKARAEFLIVVAQWAYWDQERRKPGGLIRLEINEEGQVHYRLGTKVMDKGKRMPSFFAFDDQRRETGFSAKGLLQASSLEEGSGGWRIIGSYASSYFATMWRQDVVEIAVTKGDSLESTRRELWLGYYRVGETEVSAEGLLMPVIQG